MPAAQTIRIRYQHRIEDHLQAARLYYRTTVFHLGDRIAAVVVLGMGVAGLTLVGVHWWCVLMLALAPLAWFNLLSPFPLRMRIAFRRDPKFREPYQLTFDEDGIRFETLTIDSRIDWSHFSQVLEDGQLFLLVYGKWMYSVVPKRTFSGAEEIDAFRTLLRQHIAAYRTFS